MREVLNSYLEDIAWVPRICFDVPDEMKQSIIKVGSATV